MTGLCSGSKTSEMVFFRRALGRCGLYIGGPAFSLTAIVLASWVVLVSGCSGDESSNSNAAGAAGAAASAGVGGAGGNSGSGSSNQSGGTGGAGQICEKACETVETCAKGPLATDPGSASFDTPVCVTQCDLELAGQGVLAPEIANDLFTRAANLGADPDCTLSNQYGYGMGKWDAFHTENPNAQFEVNSPDLIERCAQVETKCQWVGTEDPTVHYLDCFLLYYRYNETWRNKLESCFDLVSTDIGKDGCPEYDSCKKPLAEEEKASYPLSPWLGEQPPLPEASTKP